MQFAMDKSNLGLILICRYLIVRSSLYTSVLKLNALFINNQAFNITPSIITNCVVIVAHHKPLPLMSYIIEELGLFSKHLQQQ